MRTLQRELVTYDIDRVKDIGNLTGGSGWNIENIYVNTWLEAAWGVIRSIFTLIKATNSVCSCDEAVETL
jgi:hypothetical protein